MGLSLPDLPVTAEPAAYLTISNSGEREDLPSP